MAKSVITMSAGVVVGAVATWLVGVTPRPLVAAAKEEPVYRSLDANLYMQISAEYRANCYQAFNLANNLLKSRVKEMAPGNTLPPAVVLDLDETVLDNGAFQTQQIRSQAGYDPKVWTDWEENHNDDVALVPGAKDFVLKAKELGVATVFITNRNENSRKNCAAILERHGIAVPPEQLLLSTTTSDKTARRAVAAKSFHVLLFVGDNLRDFDDRYRYDANQGIAGRFQKVDEDKDKFGSMWVILPNCAYGEWMKPLGNSAKDADLLKPAVK